MRSGQSGHSAAGFTRSSLSTLEVVSYDAVEGPAPSVGEWGVNLPPNLPPNRRFHDRCGTVRTRVDRSYCSIVRDRDS
jgi:hypothetical protein